MVVVVEIEQDQQETKVVEIELSDAEADLISFLRPVADKTGIPVEELILDLGVGDVQFQPQWKVSECFRHGHKWRHRRVCVDLHFESEAAKHHFPARAHGHECIIGDVNTLMFRTTLVRISSSTTAVRPVPC